LLTARNFVFAARRSAFALQIEDSRDAGQVDAVGSQAPGAAREHEAI